MICIITWLEGYNCELASKALCHVAERFILLYLYHKNEYNNHKSFGIYN